MDLEALLAAVSDERPCGENLEYDADFIAMELACNGKAEQQFGDTLIPAEPADWNRVEQLASGLLLRSKDLRVMLALTRSWTQLKGLNGYANGLQLIRHAIEQFWLPLHPALEEGDAHFRINVLAGLGDKSALTLAVRQAPLLRSVSDQISLRDACSLLDGNKVDVADYPGGRTRLLEELSRAEQPLISAVDRISEHLHAIKQTLTERLGISGVPAMEQLLSTIKTITDASRITDLSALLPAASSLAEIASADGPAATAPAEFDCAERPLGAGAAEISRAVRPAASNDWHSAELQSRADAQLMLEKVKHYFSQYEPGHPAPFMIVRLQRVIELNFMEMVRDLAPDGISQLENLFGRGAS